MGVSSISLDAKYIIGKSGHGMHLMVSGTKILISRAIPEAVGGPHHMKHVCPMPESKFGCLP